MEKKVKGLVLRSTQYGDYDKLVTVLTEEGKLFFKARGIRSITSKNAAGCAPFVFSEFQIEQRGDKNYLKRAQPLFTTVRQGCDVVTLALASFMCEVAEDAALDAETGKSVLKIVMNALFILAKEDRPADLVCSVFEFRLLASLGQMPLFDACARCGSAFDDDEILYMRLGEGDFICPACFTGRDENVRRISRDVYYLARRSVSAPEKEAYALKMPPAVLKEFAQLAERYFLFQMERNYNSLKFYHEVKRLPEDVKKEIEKKDDTV